MEVNDSLLFKIPMMKIMIQMIQIQRDALSVMAQEQFHVPLVMYELLLCDTWQRRVKM